jgi:hypothetical protein
MGYGLDGKAQKAVWKKIRERRKRKPLPNCLSSYSRSKYIPVDNHIENESHPEPQGKPLGVYPGQQTNALLGAGSSEKSHNRAETKSRDTSSHR